jgi:hypothetical protein
MQSKYAPRTLSDLNEEMGITQPRWKRIDHLLRAYLAGIFCFLFVGEFLQRLAGGGGGSFRYSSAATMMLALAGLAFVSCLFSLLRRAMLNVERGISIYFGLFFNSLKEEIEKRAGLESS